MSHALTFADPARFDHWRSLPLADALALAHRPGWADEIDDSGRNLLMQACVFFANPSVLENETGFGVVFTDDLGAVLAWLLPLFDATERAQWCEPLGQCLEAVRVLQRLRNTSETDPPAVAMQILRESREDLLAHRNRWGPRFLLDVLLFYQHQEGTWQAFVDGDDLDQGTGAAHQGGALRRL